MKLQRKKIKGKNQENPQLQKIRYNFQVTKFNKIMINYFINLMIKKNNISVINLTDIKIIVSNDLLKIKKYNSSNSFSNNNSSNNILLTKSFLINPNKFLIFSNKNKKD